jgi:hypothetical protein
MKRETRGDADGIQSTESRKRVWVVRSQHDGTPRDAERGAVVETSTGLLKRHASLFGSRQNNCYPGCHSDPPEHHVRTCAPAQVSLCNRVSEFALKIRVSMVRFRP